MRTILLTILVLQLIIFPLFSQQINDSLVLFSELKYHSEFEKNTLENFIIHQKDTFNFFLAIDENVNYETASGYNILYEKIFTELNQKKIESKKIDKKIRIAYTAVHDRFLKKYNTNEYFPVMFQTGLYNCVSASMVYALVFDILKIPYKVMASSNHVYLIANPGPKSIVIETTNPSFEKVIFTGEFKQQYVSYLRNSKLISVDEYKNKSVEEIFEEKFNEVHDASLFNLPGFQYYNKAIMNVQNNEIVKAYEYAQKAYYFWPDQQVKILLYNTLIYLLEKCDYSKVTDIDYLAHFLRFDNIDENIASGLFNSILYKYLQYTDKEEYCNELFNRLSAQITNKQVQEELSFNYYLQMSYRYQNTDQLEYYINNALKIKGNHQDANEMLANHVNRKLNAIYNAEAMLDTVIQYQDRYKHTNIQPLLHDFEMIAYLRLAENAFNKNQVKTGEKYLQFFEDNCRLPVDNHILTRTIEMTYRMIANKYFIKNNVSAGNTYLNRGRKFLPTSTILKSNFF